MREMLFRGKPDREYSDDELFKDSDWVYGNLIVNGGTPFITGDFVETNEEYTILEWWCPVVPETVGQWTGLIDKNSVRMFEGDLIKTDLKRPYNIIVFRNGSFVFNCNDGYGEYYDMFFSTPQEIILKDNYSEVIGNIHDNPELFKEEI